MKEIAGRIKNHFSEAASRLLASVAWLKEDAKNMQEERDRKEISDTVPFVLIQDNLHEREAFTSLRALAEAIGMDVEDALDIVKYRNGIFGAFIIHEVDPDDSSFSVY